MNRFFLLTWILRTGLCLQVVIYKLVWGQQQQSIAQASMRVQAP